MNFNKVDFIEHMAKAAILVKNQFFDFVPN
jgi:hypothetical protein